MGHNIEKAGDRSKLEPRREPYWDRIEAGCFLGYRKLEDGTGTWIARWRNEEGGQKYHAIGSTPSVGYDAAVKAARQWFAQCKGGSTEVITVEEACRRYVIDRRSEKGEGTAKDAEGRFNRLVYGTKFGKIKLPSLRTAHISDWRNAQIAQDDDAEDNPDAERRAKDSTNRNLATLKAALNLAYRMGLASSTEQWDRVQSYQKVAKRRDVSLSMLDRKKLITAASPDLKVFLNAMLLTGCRPGELAGCVVGDLDSAGLLTVAGKTGRRTIPISPKALALLKSAAGDRPGRAAADSLRRGLDSLRVARCLPGGTQGRRTARDGGDVFATPRRHQRNAGSRHRPDDRFQDRRHVGSDDLVELRPSHQGARCRATCTREGNLRSAQCSSGSRWKPQLHGWRRGLEKRRRPMTC